MGCGASHAAKQVKEPYSGSEKSDAEEEELHEAGELLIRENETGFTIDLGRFPLLDAAKMAQQGRILVLRTVLQDTTKIQERRITLPFTWQASKTSAEWQVDHLVITIKKIFAKTQEEWVVWTTQAFVNAKAEKPDCTVKFADYKETFVLLMLPGSYPSKVSVTIFQEEESRSTIKVDIEQTRTAADGGSDTAIATHMSKSSFIAGHEHVSVRQTNKEGATELIFEPRANVQQLSLLCNNDAEEAHQEEDIPVPFGGPLQPRPAIVVNEPYAEGSAVAEGSVADGAYTAYDETASVAQSVAPSAYDEAASVAQSVAPSADRETDTASEESSESAGAAEGSDAPADQQPVGYTPVWLA